MYCISSVIEYIIMEVSQNLPIPITYNTVYQKAPMTMTFSIQDLNTFEELHTLKNYTT